MDSFEVLVVDDDETILALADKATQVPGVIIHKASGLAEANALIGNHFFHLALVDIQLVPYDDANDDGLSVLNSLWTLRPSCERVLLTRRLAENLGAIVKTVDPLNRLVDGIVSKQDWDAYFVDVIKRKASSWLLNRVTVNGITEVATALSKAARGQIDVQITEEEVAFVVSRLFGQCTRLQDGSDRENAQYPPPIVASELRHVDLEPLSGGRSSSIVLRTRPRTSDRGAGIWCVVKIGMKDGAREEYKRFDRYVRYRLPTNVRVELLGYEEADTIGALCYSFAGTSPDKRITTLQEVFVKRQETALSVFEQLFDYNQREWYGAAGTAQSLADYFTRTFPWLHTLEVHKAIEKFAQRMAGKLNGRSTADALIIQGTKCHLPKQALALDVFRKEMPTCIVHGDLHGGNIIVGEEGGAIMIDYRSTGVGPRCLDFAALESSIRLSTSDDVDNLASLRDRLRCEKGTWKLAWGGAAIGTKGKAVNHQVDMEYWQRMALRLAQLVQTNFSEITPTEYAATCLLWSLRLFSNRALNDNQRLVLLAWMSELSTRLTGLAEK